MTNDTQAIEPTVAMAKSLQEITDYLDALLFEGKLPPCYVTLTRNNKVIGGYHSKDQWENTEGDKIPEIGINSNLIAEGDPLTLYNVLIHELIHLELSHNGTGGRVGYHNKAFAARCHDMDLEIKCHDKNAREGQETGQAISTHLIEGGKAEQAIAQIPTDLAYHTSKVIDIDANGQPQEGAAPKTAPLPKAPPQPKKQGGKRSKYVCPTCGLAMWGKSFANVICGDCGLNMIAS